MATITVGTILYRVSSVGCLHAAEVWKVTPKLAYIRDARDGAGSRSAPGAFGYKSQLPIDEAAGLERSDKAAWKEYAARCGASARHRREEAAKFEAEEIRALALSA